MQKELVTLEKINLTYNRNKDNAFQALFDVSLKINQGEFAIIFGPSGCGKSTLLNIIAGLEAPDSGKVVIDGKSMIGPSEKELVDFHRVKTGMIFQAYNLISTLSVLDNVALPQIFLGASKKERDKRGLALLERFGIREHWKKIPTELSGGQQQRIGVARSIVNDPAIVLADEPVGNLDSESSNNVMQILSDLNKKEGKTIIMVSHNPESVDWGTHIIKMKDGKIEKEEFKDALGRTTTKEEGGKEEKLSKFEKLLASFKGLSEEQIGILMAPAKAKLIAQSLLVTYEEAQVDRIEDNIQMRIMDAISVEDLVRKFDQPLEKGGSELDKRSAFKFGKEVEELMVVAQLAFKKGDIEKRAAAILEYLNRQDDININEKEAAILGALIKGRLLEKIDYKKFKELVDISKDLGGAGLDKRVARKVLRKIDLILIVGYGLEAGRSASKKEASQKVEETIPKNDDSRLSPFLIN